MKKKVTSLFLMLTMCLSLAAPAFAAGPQSVTSDASSEQNIWTIQADVISEILDMKQSCASQRTANSINMDETISALSNVYLEIEKWENSGGMQSSKSFSELQNEKTMLETALENNGQYILSDEEVASVIRGSSFGEERGHVATLSVDDAVICPDDTANNKWVCSSVHSQSGYSYYTLTVIPQSARSSLFETHSKNTNSRIDWAECSTKLLYEKVVGSAIATVDFGLLGTLISVLEDLNDTTACSLTYNIAVTSYPKFTFVYDANADEFFCTLITHSANISQVIIANVPNMSSSARTELNDKLLVTTNHTSSANLAISRFRQGKTWSQVERVGYCSIVYQKGSSTQVTVTGFEPPYATGIYTVN